MSSNSATAFASQQSIKAYVDSQVTAQDLDFQGDSGGALSIDLDCHRNFNINRFYWNRYFRFRKYNNF